MAFKALLEIEGNEYQVLFSKVDMTRHVDGKGAGLLLSHFANRAS